MGQLLTVEKHKLKRNGNNSVLAPELREFIDRVVVPILVRDFLKSHARMNALADVPGDEVESVPFQTVPAEVTQ